MKKNKIPLFKINEHVLFREQNLVVGQIPIFFVCIDDTNQRYLVIDLDFDTDKYLIAQVSNGIIFDMLSAKITMREAFSKAKQICYLFAGETMEEDEVCEVVYSEIDDEDLPDNDAYFSVSTYSELLEYMKSLCIYEVKLNKRKIYSISNLHLRSFIDVMDFMPIRGEIAEASHKNKPIDTFFIVTENNRNCDSENIYNIRRKTTRINCFTKEGVL